MGIGEYLSILRRTGTYMPGRPRDARALGDDWVCADQGVGREISVEVGFARFGHGAFNRQEKGNGDYKNLAHRTGLAHMPLHPLQNRLVNLLKIDSFRIDWYICKEY